MMKRMVRNFVLIPAVLLLVATSSARAATDQPDGTEPSTAPGSPSVPPAGSVTDTSGSATTSTSGTLLQRDGEGASDLPKLRLVNSPTRNTLNDPSPSSLPGLGTTTRLYIGEGTSAEPPATMAPTINVQRYINPNLVPNETGLINFFRAKRTGTGNAYAVENLVSYFTSDSTYAGFSGGNDVTGIASHTFSLAGSTSRAYGIYSDTRLYNKTAHAYGLEVDVVNESGQLAPISTGSTNAGGLYGIFLVPRVYFNAASREASTGIFFQSTGHPASGYTRFRQGIFFAPNSITERGIDMTKIDLAYSGSPGFVCAICLKLESYITYESGGGLVKAFGMDTAKNVWIGDAGARVTAGGVFTSVSSRAAKTNFTSASTGDILKKIARLPVTFYDYRNAPGERHIGPVAEDFHAAFGVGDSRSISAGDLAGVALAAIKALNEKIEKQQAEIDRLQSEVKSLRRQRRRP